jgi:hypothetical protein
MSSATPLKAESPAPRFRALAALLWIIALGGIALGCLPSGAQASETVKLTVAFSPYKLGSTTTIEVNVTIANSDGGVPGPVTSFDTRMPPKLELVGSTLGLAICKPAALLADGLEGCSPNARLGTGTAQVEVPFGPETVGETANVDALMGPPAGENLGVLLYAEGRSPVFAQSVFPGVLLLGGGALGESLNTTVPVTPTLPGAPDVSVSSMQLSLGPDHLTYYKKVHGKTVGYQPQGISLPSICPRGGFTFLTEMTFQDGTYLKVPSTVPCPPSRHR